MSFVLDIDCGFAVNSEIPFVSEVA